MKKLISIFVLILTMLVANQPVESQTLKHTSKSDSNVTLVGRWLYGPCETSFVVANYAYIGNGTAMDVLDISDHSAPIRVGKL
jgi:hypothetical protein